MYVVRKDLRTCAVWVAPGYVAILRNYIPSWGNVKLMINNSDHPSLLTRSLTCPNFVWIWAQGPREIWDEKGMQARVKVRHVGGDIGAIVQA